MRKGIAIHGLTEETLQLLPLLEANPRVEIRVVFDPDRDAATERLRQLDASLATAMGERLTDDPERLVATEGVQAVVDAGAGTRFADRCPTARERGLEIVSPLTARLLWGYGGGARDRKSDLLQALHEVVDSVDLAVDTDELFERMLEIAISTIGAEQGSLMLLDTETRELRIRVAVGVERELWEKIRVPLGEGIAGRVAADGRPLLLRGRADRQAYRIVRERGDVESAICVPLLHDGAVLGVVNLATSSRTDAFTQADLEFAEQLARLDARIIARAQEHEALREKAARYAIARELGDVLQQRTPIGQRLQALCRYLAERFGDGIASVYLFEEGDPHVQLAATSLAGGGFGTEYRVRIGEGIDGRVAHERRPSFLRGEDGALVYASLPLVAGDQLVGILTVQAGSSPPTRQTLLEIADATAESIAQSTREARMSARATKVSAIGEMGIRLISITDIADVVQLATSSAAMILEADHAILRLKDQETGRFVIRSYHGSADGPLQEKLFQLDKRVSVDAIKRRAPFAVREVSADPSLVEFGADVRSLVAAPLKHEGQLIGTLAIYDKIAPDGFHASVFREDDVQIFTRFVSYAERAVANAELYSAVKRHGSVDAETGLPNETYLEQRLGEEIARAAGRDGALALVVCQIENWGRISREADSEQITRIVRRSAEALRHHVRDFDLVARTGEAFFSVMLPDPGAPADETVSKLARAVAEEVSNDDRINTPVRLALAFGFAVYPGDGADRESLRKHAALPRIRMV
ncbi:MAG: GAF domain-containing protein [Deltaproteobacteria bacterium]|nr:MAG: GAF domain-containing protein [Deltaproteobacteria bacterium]